MRKDAAFGPATGFASRERQRTRALQDAVALIPVAAEGTRRIADGWNIPKPMDSEWSRSAAVLCRSRWQRDAKERGVWSRTGSASRERERTHALQDAVALIPVAAEGTRRIADGWNIPKPMDSELSRSAAVRCRSCWERDAKERGVWSRNEVCESRVREDSRTPGRCRDSVI